MSPQRSRRQKVPRLRARARALALLLALFAHAWPGRAAEPAAEETPSATDERHARAKQHFERGLALAREQSNWDAALREFLASRALYPTRSATRNAAVALRELGRFVESFELYRQLLDEFSASMTAEELRETRAEAAALKPQIGELDLHVDPPGTAVHVDRQARGTTPLASTVVVPPGQHTLRLSKQGYEARELEVHVRAGELRYMAEELRPLTEAEQLAARPAPAPPVAAASSGGDPPRRRWFAEVVLGGSFAGSVNGGAGQSCNCETHPPALGILSAARAGYSPVARLAAELTVGYTSITESMTRTVVAQGDKHAPRWVSTDYEDSTRLSGPLAALTGSFRALEKTPVTARAGFGVAFLISDTQNSGTFAGELSNPRDPSVTEPHVAPLSIEEAAELLVTPFATTELRLGYRFTDRVSADFGVGLFLFFPPEKYRVGTNTTSNGTDRTKPLPNPSKSWENGLPMEAGSLTLPRETIAGTFLAFAPSLALRVDF